MDEPGFLRIVLMIFSKICGGVDGPAGTTLRNPNRRASIMAKALGNVVRHIKRLAVGGCVRSDRDLLQSFWANRDELAFTALVYRHGPMVLRVCRRVLRHEQDAEDAFQAAFLVFARSAAAVRKPDVLGPWLYGVAYRTAMKAKRTAARRRRHETRQSNVACPASATSAWDGIQATLDEEIQRLAEPYKSAFVLCVLEGKTGPEVAAVLNVKEGTVSSRLTRARQQLQRRLLRRGIKLATALAAVSVSDLGAKAGVPALLAEATIRSGLLSAAGGMATAQIPTHIAALAAGVTRAMFLSKAKIATAMLVAVSLCGGAAVRIHQVIAGPENQVAGLEKRAMPASGKGEPATRPTPHDDKDTASFAGRVVGPDKKGMAGAKVYFHFFTHQDEAIPVRAITDANGRFSFTLTRKDVPLSAVPSQSDPLKTGHVLVKADKFTITWTNVTKPTLDLMFQVAEDTTPITGRIRDLEGKPLAGLRVSALSAWAAENADLAPFLKELHAGKSLYDAGFKNLPNHLGTEIVNRNAAQAFPGDNNRRRRKISAAWLCQGTSC